MISVQPESFSPRSKGQGQGVFKRRQAWHRYSDAMQSAWGRRYAKRRVDAMQSVFTEIFGRGKVSIVSSSKDPKQLTAVNVALSNGEAASLEEIRPATEALSESSAHL